MSKSAGWGAAALSQLHGRKTEPYFMCSSLEVEIFTALCCQINSQPRSFSFHGPSPREKAKPLSFSIPIFHTIVQMKPLWNRPHLSQELSAPTTTCISPSYKLYYRCSHPFSNQPMSILRARHVTCSSMYLQHLAQGRMSGGWEAFRYPPLFQAESSRSMVLPIWGYDHLP